ncbi:TMEM175 family protein [Mucilaginibacter pedocola]|uniref:DUF1211 domain-containing membrane protein n=1 Tax=Mucilaginibacter pedocola TaxID=1792845 RepID=A0A1S9PF99_9SPHI|nr:TMEM175 family protein [Mucilaginibacter pedocola]OOQ59579.1 hypothetical protein BC343_05275 [Mucilaginibacter pedocola]
MNIQEEEEIKKEFQLERVILFSDAVFAIIITIMVLEIKLPEGLRHAERSEVQHAIIEVLPRLFGYMTAFFFVGMFWLKHLKMFSYLKDYSKGLIIWNLVFLFFISLFPFGVSAMIESLGPGSAMGLFIYFNVIALSMLGQTMLTGYLVNHADTLCIKPKQLQTNLQWKVQKLNYISIPVLYAYIICCLYFEVPTAFFSLGFLLWAVTNIRARKKFYKAEDDAKPVLNRLFASRKKQPAAPDAAE